MRRWAHLAALSALALAEPLYDLLGNNPEFFSVRGTTRAEIVVFAVGLVLVPPTVLFAIERLAGLVHPRLRDGLYLVFVAALVATIALQLLKGIGGPPAVPIALAAVCGLGAGYAYRRLKPFGSTLTVLAGAGPVFLALFLVSSPVSKLVLTSRGQVELAPVSARTPVVLVVFDEFPIGSLMDGRRRIDSVRYPGFGELARDALWFRNATTVHESTTHAVPAILTGIAPRRGELPRYADHPHNLFTLLGRGYDIEAFERDTRLCPPRLCHGEAKSSFGSQLRSLVVDSSVVYAHVLLPDRLASDLPSASQSWQDFLGRGRDEPARFESFLAAIRPRARPALYVIHALLPHSPWQYLPNGTPYTMRYPVAPWGPTEFWSSDRGLVLQNEQRNLLQTAFVDRLVSRLLHRLRASGLYDRSLVIVTADHGISFEPGHKRRPVWPGNLHDIAYVPLFVKLPGTTHGRVVDAHVQTIDIVPTIADVLGVRVPWHLDGRSALAARGAGPPVAVMKNAGLRIVSSLAALNRRRYESLAHRLALFGAGTPVSQLYGVGRFRGLLGRRIDMRAIGVVRGARVELNGTPMGAPVDVSGRVIGPNAADVHDVAVVVAGRVAAVVPVYAAKLWVLVPSIAKAQAIELLSISGAPGAPRLRRLPTA